MSTHQINGLPWNPGPPAAGQIFLSTAGPGQVLVQVADKRHMCDAKLDVAGVKQVIRALQELVPEAFR